MNQQSKIGCACDWEEMPECDSVLDKSNAAKRPADSISSSMSSTEILSDSGSYSECSDSSSQLDTLNDDLELQTRQLDTAAKMLLELADLSPEENHHRVKVSVDIWEVKGETLNARLNFSCNLNAVNPYVLNKLYLVLVKNVSTDMWLEP